MREPATNDSTLTAAAMQAVAKKQLWPPAVGGGGLAGEVLSASAEAGSPPPEGQGRHAAAMTTGPVIAAIGNALTVRPLPPPPSPPIPSQQRPHVSAMQLGF